MLARTLAMCAAGLICSTQSAGGQVLSQYRNFELGSDLATVSSLAAISPADAKTMHQRPAVLQDLEWRPSRWVAGTMADSNDPVELIMFSFYDNQLFRVVVDYGRERTEGMTGPDMIDAISAVYGTPRPRPSRVAGRTASRLEIESGSALAGWGDADHAIVLYQIASYVREFRLLVTDTRLESLARKAEAQAVRLESQQAPARELARQRQERDDGRAAAEKARAANKPGFRP